MNNLTNAVLVLVLSAMTTCTIAVELEAKHAPLTISNVNRVCSYDIWEYDGLMTYGMPWIIPHWGGAGANGRVKDQRVIDQYSKNSRWCWANEFNGQNCTCGCDDDRWGSSGLGMNPSLETSTDIEHCKYERLALNEEEEEEEYYGH